jgi:hypothetical protein
VLVILTNKLYVMTCIPDGNPSIYTYYKWQHKSKHGVLIRELDGGQNGVLTLPSISVEDRYQDSGEYVCHNMILSILYTVYFCITISCLSYKHCILQ